MVKAQAPIASIPNLLFSETLFISKRSLHIFRLICLGMFLVALSYNIYIDGPIEIFKYLTVWGMMFVGIYNLLMVVDYYNKLNKRWKRVTELLFEAGFSFQLLITAFFWVFIYQHLKDKYEASQLDWYNTLYLHGFCLFQIYYDYSFNTLLIKFCDIFYIASTGICYVFVNYCYTVLIEPVYPVMTFKDNATYVYIVLAIAGVIIHFLHGFGIGKLVKRRYISNLEDRIVKTLKF